MKTTPYIYVLLLLSQMAFAQAETADNLENKLVCGYEQKPEFPGGEKALMQYLADNIRYPAIDDSEPIIGSKIFISFTVEKDGCIENVKVVRGIHRVWDETAANVMRGMPQWKPAMQNGKAVCVQYTLPVRVRLE